MRPSAGEALLQLETIGLLLQLAWADLEVHEKEAQLVLERATSLGVPPFMVEQISRCLRAEEPLPAPDLQLLKGRKEDVLQACHALLAVDDQITAEEQEILDLVTATLGG